jgi:flavin reductase (DIM6/NTAB) family NADH-FMN oxidoreductase RutF
MVDGFREIQPTQVADNPFKLIGSDWMLITAGTMEHLNTMTASWGGVGILWGRPVAWCVIRPGRYTFEFIEQASAFTLSFFADSYRDVLNLCGSKSGRDVDKVQATGLTPVQASNGGIYFAQARLVMVCNKIYYQDLDPQHFLDPTIERNYPIKDYHRMYMGEIVQCLSREA